MWKMDRQHKPARSGGLAEKSPARPRRLFGVPIEDRRPIRLTALQRVVHQVADDDRVLSARSDIDAAMAWRMARRRRQPERIVELIVVVDKERLAGGDDRL